eukprot:137979_1
MPNSSNQLVLSLLSSLLTIYAEILYVSKNGSDSSHCGLTVDTACGTLYAATANVYDNSSEIFVYNGQNEDEINKYFILNETNIWHPCLPYPYATVLSITFNNESIHEMNDWFMKGICYENNHPTIKYRNTYLFDTTHRLTNLRIDHYNTDIIPFAIFHGQFSPMNCWSCEVKYECDHCTFDNISYKLDRPMINIFTDIAIMVTYHVKNCKFKNIRSTESTAHLINVHTRKTSAVLLTRWNNNIILTDVSITNVTFYSTMLYFGTFYNAYVTLNVIIFNSRLEHIHTKPSIISLIGEINYSLNISATIFENIIHGSIIKSSYPHDSCTEPLLRIGRIYIDNVSISSSQTHSQITSGIFNFQSMMTDNITIQNINVMYYYDMSVNCQFIDENIGYSCNNPAPFMYNEGYVSFKENNSFNITIISDDYSSINKYNDYTSFIENDGTMFAQDITIYNIALGYTIFSGDGILQLSNVVIDTITLSANALQPYAIIFQDGSLGNNLNISDCILKGGRSHTILSIGSASVYIVNTTFKDSMGILQAFGGLFVKDSYFSVVIKLSEFYDIGCFYIPSGECTCSDNSFYVGGGDVSLMNNTFRYYPHCGFAEFVGGDNLLLQNNTFIITNHSRNNIETSRSLGLLTIRFFTGSTLISNEFHNNNDRNVPWLYYDRNPAFFEDNNSGFNCFSDNKLDNFAIKLSDTNLTSCFRPELADCLSNDDICASNTYGIVNKNMSMILNTKSTFSGNINISSIWILDNYSGIALDNVQISNQLLTIQYGMVFLVDSYVVSTDIWYESELCNVIFNDRMKQNSTQIAKLLIKCRQPLQSAAYNNTAWDYSMNAITTNYVTNFSPIKLHFSATNNTYWPGSRMKFYYFISDIFGNIIKNYTPNGHVFAVIENVNLSLLNGFLINEYGECALCEEGVIIPGANLLETFGNSYTISVDLHYDYLLLDNAYVHLKVVGCPKGFGATSNKYQCEKCPTDKYNPISNNRDACLLCDKNGEGKHQCSEY